MGNYWLEYGEVEQICGELSRHFAPLTFRDMAGIDHEYDVFFKAKMFKPTHWRRVIISYTGGSRPGEWIATRFKPQYPQYWN